MLKTYLYLVDDQPLQLKNTVPDRLNKVNNFSLLT